MARSGQQKLACSSRDAEGREYVLHLTDFFLLHCLDTPFPPINIVTNKPSWESSLSRFIDLQLGDSLLFSSVLPYEKGRECICTVCTCGCHKYGDITSEYGAKYPEWPMPQKFQRNLPTLRPSTAPMSSTTTYRDTYINHPLSPPSSTSCRPAPQPRPCQKETDYRTTYHMNYWDKSAQMCTPQAKAPQTQHCTSGNKQFEGQSMYQLQFPNHGPQPRCNKQPVSRPAAGSLNTVKSRQKLDCDSTYHDDYRQWALPAKCVHKRECSPPPARNECGPTTYQSDYVDRHALRPCPVLSRAKPTDVCGDHMCY